MNTCTSWKPTIRGGFGSGTRSFVAAIFFLLFFLGAASKAGATHIVGGEMTYRCLGNNQYEVTLRIYRDCFFGAPDAQFDSVASIGVFDVNGNLIYDLRVPIMNVNDTLEANVNDTCLFIPSNICVHTTFYRDTVELPAIPGGYTLAYQRCCRNGTIANIFDPLETGATFSTRITFEALQQCNNSAQFGDWPPLFICVGEPINFDHSATDADGDQLVYRLCTPFKGASPSNGRPQPPSAPPYEPVELKEPAFTLDNLLGLGEPLAIDPQTGLLTGSPTLIGQFVVGVCVEEYRNGVLISTTRRDFQYNVGLCDTVEAAVSAPDIQCDDLEVTFENKSRNANRFLWLFNDPGNPGASSTEKDPVYTFSDTGTYTVTLIAAPTSTCADTTFHTIRLVNNTLNADFDVEVLNCGDTVFIYGKDRSEDPGSSIVSYFWELSYGATQLTSTDRDGRFFIPKTPLPVSLVLTVESANTCERSKSLTFNVDPVGPPGLFADTFNICEGEMLELNPSAPPDLVYLWSPADLVADSTAPNPLVSLDSTQLFTVTIADSSGQCISERTVRVEVQTLDPAFNVGLECNGFRAHFNNATTGASAFFWDFGDTTSTTDTTSFIAPVFVFPDTGKYLVTLIAWPQAPCMKPDTLTKVVDIGGPVLQARIEGDYLSCGKDSAVVVFSSDSKPLQGKVIEWSWTLQDSININDSILPALTFYQTDTIRLKLLVRTDEECADSTDQELVVLLNGDVSFPDTVTACQNGGAPLNPNPDLAYQYRWSPVAGLDDPTSPNPVANPAQSTMYTVAILAIGVDTCVAMDSVYAEVPSPLSIDAPDDFATCDAEVSLQASAVGATGYRWLDETGQVLSDGPTLVDSPIGPTTYVVEITDSIGCVYTDTVAVDAQGVDIETTDPAIFCQQSTVMLSITNLDPADTLTYSWSPAGDILSGDTTATPVIDASEPGVRMFAYAVENQYGCTAMDSVEVVVADSALAAGIPVYGQCEGLTVSFEYDGPLSGYYTWDFGDPSDPGATATGGKVTHTYSDTGRYTVRAILPAQGCPDTLELAVDVGLGPFFDARLQADYLDCGLNSVDLRIADTSLSVQNDLTERRWTIDGQVLATDTSVLNFQFQSDTSFHLQLFIAAVGGCVDSVDQLIEVKVIESLDLPDSITICGNTPVGLNPGGDPAYDYLWMPSTGLSDPMAINPVARLDSTIDYTVAISAVGAATCTLLDSLHVEVIPGIDLDTPDDFVTCKTTLELTAVSNKATMYEWRDNSGAVIGQEATVTVSPLLDSYYTVIASDTGQCDARDTIIVNGFGVNAAFADSIAAACEGSPVTVSLIQTDPEDMITYQWMPDSLVLAGMDSSVALLRADLPGVFWVRVLMENQFGCSRTDSIRLGVLTDSLGLDFDYSVECDGLTVSFQNKSTNTPFVKWLFNDPNNPGANSLKDNPVYTYQDTGSYVVALTTGFDLACSDTVYQTIDISDIFLQARIDVNQTTCNEDTVILQFADASINTRNNTTSWRWQFKYGNVTSFVNEPNAVIILDDSTVVSVQFTIETADGCFDTASLQLVIQPLKDVQLQDTLVICDGGGVFLNPDPNPAFEYLWMPADSLDDPTASNPFANPTEPTTYTVLITNQFADSCQAIRTVHVIPAPPFDFTDRPEDFSTCEAETMLSAAASTDVSYTWRNQDGQVIGTDSVVTVPAMGATVYTVEVEDAFGCSLSDTVTVTGNGIELDVQDAYFFCDIAPATIQVNGLDSNDMIQYQWSPNPYIVSALDTSVIELDADTPATTVLVLRTENQFGCTREDSLLAIIIDSLGQAPEVYFGQCEGYTVRFVLSGPYADFYTWDFGDPSDPGASASGDSVSHTYAGPGNYTVRVIFAASLPCADTIFLPVTVVEPPAFSLGYDWDFDLCQRDSVVLEFTDNSAHAQDQIESWRWRFSNGDSLLQNTGQIVLFDDISLSFTLEVSTRVGCMAALSDTLEIGLIDVFIPDTVETCKGVDVPLIQAPDSSFTYLWSPSTGLDDITSPAPIAGPDSSTTYTVQVRNVIDGKTCLLEKAVALELFPEFGFQTSGNMVRCDDAPIRLEAFVDRPVFFEWSDEPDFSNILANAPFLDLPPGLPDTFYLRATDNFGCVERDTLIAGNFQANVVFPEELELCSGGVVQIEGVELFPVDDLVYTWSPQELVVGGGDSFRPVVQPSQTTVFVVEVTHPLGCTFTDTVLVKVSDVDVNLIVIANPDTISLGGQSQLFATFGDTYEYRWNPAESLNRADINNPVARPIVTTLYTLQVTTEEGCSIRKDVEVVVIDRGCSDPYIFVPRAFTPNDDGENDILFVRGKAIERMEFLVYNRWGEQVFRSSSPVQGWDGFYEGKEAPADVYGYYLSVECINGEKYVTKGNVTLLR